MAFFEKFKSNNSRIEEGEPIKGKREYSLDDARRELNSDLKTKEIISANDPLSPDEEERKHIEVVSNLRSDQVEVVKNNIKLLMTEINENNKKIKRMRESIEETERMEAEGERPVISAESYKKIIKSLEKLNDEKESLIKTEEQKITDRYSLN